MTSIPEISQPRLRDGVEVRFSSDHARITYRSRSCTLAFPPEGREPLTGLFGKLRLGGRNVTELGQEFPEIAGQLNELLVQLDGARMITETCFPKATDAISGRQLYREVYRIAQRLRNQMARSRFYALVTDGSASRQQLIGYVLEYYWLVRTAPGLIAPALSTTGHQAERKLLQNFLASELGHDAFLAAALAAVEIDVRNLEFLEPLPTTFSICASLGAYAKQHPLSFKSVLFLFEEPQVDFVAAFERRCAELRLPEGFYTPLRGHANLNESADHDAISAQLLSLVPAIDHEEQTVVKRNVAVMVETMIRQEDEIIDYYGSSTHQSPRLFV